MPSFDRIDINKKRTPPAGIKLILLILVIFGFSIKSCWQKKQFEYYEISNIKVSEFTSQSIDVEFDITNRTNMETDKNIFIEVYGSDNTKIGSRITTVHILPRTTKTYLKVLQKLDRPIKNSADIGKVRVQLYNPSIFK